MLVDGFFPGIMKCRFFVSNVRGSLYGTRNTREFLADGKMSRQSNPEKREEFSFVVL
jgi:hypothetical protein